MKINKILVSTFIITMVAFSSFSLAEDVTSYDDLDLEDLLSLEITSVSKKKQRLTEAAAAIYVITAEDIRRSGVTSIPEALRMAPGLQVAKMDNNKWAISSRGFNAQFANKLLVLMDGRSVYTPSYSGVYWEVQDTAIEDIARIEVIRGPGATLWGANAVNGVINIITKNASETHGGLVVAGAGNEEKGYATLRYGQHLGDNTHGRAYLKFNDRDSSYSPALNTSADDDWESFNAGFRFDGEIGKFNKWTFQGDIYDRDLNQTVGSLFVDPNDPANNPPNFASPYQLLNIAEKFDASGWNLLGRWERNLENDASFNLQVYYDHSERSELILDQEHNIFDIDFQHQFIPLEGHQLIWGLGYRNVKDEFNNSYGVRLLPSNASSQTFSAFIQDEISLLNDKLRVTIGSKFEENDYTGFEFQPNIRAVWLPREGHTLWGSLSRAVRTPSRIEDSGILVTAIIPQFPAPAIEIITSGTSDFESEELTALEFGYRVQPRENLSLDLSLFYNEYDNFQTFETTGFSNAVIPVFPFVTTVASQYIFDNKSEASVYGLELAMDWHLKEWWRLKANYSYLDVSLDLDSISTDTISPPVSVGSVPQHQVYFRSSMDLSDSWQLDVWAHYVDKLQQTSFSNPQSIPEYTSLNARLAWFVKENIELSVIGNNLLDDRHPEFVGERYITPTEIERSIYAQVRWEL
jgi:iron complex outermembrane receptor protein